MTDKNSVADWSTTATDNDNIAGVPLAENLMYPRHVNNALRTMMAQLKAAIGGTAVSTFIQTLLDDADASAAQTTLGISTFIKTLLDDADASTAQTTLGISTFIKTLLDDADANTARTTLGLAWESVSTTAATGLTAITVTNLSAFRKLRIIGELAPVGTNAPLAMRFSTDNGSTYLSGSSEYLRNANSVVSGPTNTPVYDVDAYRYLNTIENCKTGELISFETELTAFNASASRCQQFWKSIFYGASSGNRIFSQGAGTTAGTTARNALQITMPGSTSFGGNVVIEGMRG